MLLLELCPLGYSRLEFLMDPRHRFNFKHKLFLACGLEVIIKFTPGLHVLQYFPESKMWPILHEQLLMPNLRKPISWIVCITTIGGH